MVTKVLGAHARLGRVGARTVAIAAVVTLVITFGTAASAQEVHTRTDAIRGRVTTDSGAVVVGADAIVTMAPSAEVFRAATDSSGRYAITIPNGTGEYLLFIGAPGRRPLRQRLTRRGGDTTFVVDAKLASSTTTIATVRVQAQRPRPARTPAYDGPGGTAATDKIIDGVQGGLSADQLGNLDALASLVPGITVGAAGATAFGLSAADNETTLNGLSFAGTDLPRDVPTRTRFSTSIWDPSSGGYSGIQNSTNVGGGGDISTRTGHLNLDLPALQFSDPTAAHLGQEFTNIDFGVGEQGPLVLEKTYYTYGVQLKRKTSSVLSLLDLDPQSLAVAGVSADSAAKLLQLLGTLHMPATLAGIPAARTTTTATILGRFDHAPPPASPRAIPKPAWWLMGTARLSDAEAQTLSPVAPPSNSGKTNGSILSLQGFYAKYFGSNGDYLNETSSGISFSDTRSAPYLELPGANVLVASTLADGTDAIGALPFGGNGALMSESKSWRWEAVNNTNFLLGGRASLPFRLYLQSRFDGYNTSGVADRFGTFTYPSLSAIANNSPSSFSRALNVPSQTGGEWVGAAALGGNWTSGKFSMTGGVRADANAFTSAPPENPQINSLFGVHNNQAPSTVELSPRLGFVWRYGGPPEYAFRTWSVGSVYQGLSQVRGGIGRFRSILAPTLLSGASTATGLPGGAQRLLCTGPATPTPNWQSYEADAATAPESCVGTSTFADTAPSVQLFSRSYSPSESWRGTLGWTKSFSIAYLAIDGTYSLNLHQPGTVDLNFSGVPRFNLVDEANRPVFVSPTSIAPTSGSISSVEARTNAAFGPVLERVSDLRGVARQITVYAIPSIPYRFGLFTLAYTYFDSRSLARGFDQSTAGDPRDAGWAGNSPHHQFIVQGVHYFGKVAVSALLRASSGFPYTPLVAGDINGDGSSNDRAFIYNPATAHDTALASGMRSLVASAPSTARSCLAAQFGQIAGRNSCTGPWSATMNGYVYFMQALPASDGRAHLTINITNVLGGLDELFHGSTHLQGWGTPAFPDQTLYRVSGFNPSTQEFVYVVNPRFGSASLATTAIRNPFRVTFGVSVDLGRPFDAQTLDQNLRVRPALVGTRAPVDSIRRRYADVYFQDLYGVLLRFSDSLALSRDQIEKFQKQRPVLLARGDSAYGILARYLVALPNNYNEKEVLKRVNETITDAWKLVLGEKSYLETVLMKGQIRLLPTPIYLMMTQPGYNGRFRF